MIRVYLTDVRELEYVYEPALNRVGTVRRQKIARHAKRGDQLRSLGAGLLLRRVLGFCEDGAMEYGEYGKPRRTGVDPFSLTHSGDIAALAVGDHEVGIDIEKIEPYDERVAARFFAPEEYAYWREADDKDQAFFTIWTIKESIMKGTGRGLSLSPADFSILPLNSRKHVIDGEEWYYDYRLVGHYILAVATRDEPVFMKMEALSAADLLQDRVRSTWREITLTASIAHLDDAVDFVAEPLQQHAFDERRIMEMEIATEEIFMNIVHYAYDDQPGPVKIGLEMNEAATAVSVVFADGGRPFDPLAHAAPELDVEQERSGGLGILLIKTMVDNVDYRYEGGQNILCVSKAKQ